MNNPSEILIVCDSFKGCLSSSEAGNAIAAGMTLVFPDCRCRVINVSDGGEGTMDSLFTPLGCKRIECRVNGPLKGVDIDTSYAISEDCSTAVMDVASVIGLPLIEEKDIRLPRTTSGLGEMILHAAGNGVKRIIIGLGGSATHDCGVGMLSRLGIRFYDSDGNTLTDPDTHSLASISGADMSSVNPLISGIEFTGACDVDNPLYGSSGSARVFSPQKKIGIPPDELDEITRGFARRLASTYVTDAADAPGAGAAGGLGFALKAFLKARLKSGAELVLDANDFDNALCNCDLVVTGEGKMDSQTGMGKLPDVVLKRAASSGIPVIALTGSIEDARALNSAGFAAVFCIQQGPVTLTEAMAPCKALHNLTSTSIQIANLLKL